MDSEWNDKILKVGAPGFGQLALEVFRFQYQGNDLYRAYAAALGRGPANVNVLADIPFLPIRFFKSSLVKTGAFATSLLFESSGTTGSVNSRHAVADPMLYRDSFLACFREFYGDPQDYVILGLLPSYLERSNSSLVYMVNELISLSGHRQSGFYLAELGKLAATIQALEMAGKKTLLIGVTFALLDFAAAFPMELRHTTIVETGGMKGRRSDMIRAEVHDHLQAAFGPAKIHSEYGMTELLSQAWSAGDGLFRTPGWMRVMLREEEDPLSVSGPDASNTRSGAINVIDLANVHSCSFIATDDAARLHSDGTFEVLGRLDNSDIRGCSLLSL